MMAMDGKETICNVLHGFQDILRDRRTSSDFLWASRDWNPSCANAQQQKPSPILMKSIVLSSYQLSEVIKEISREKNIPLEYLYKNVRHMLDEIGYERKVPVLRWLGFFTAKILKKLCSGVFVNENVFYKIKSQMGKNPVLFVPSHRSYGDFILMSFLCFHFDVDIPRIAAGMDFHSMMFLGSILRDSCAFFMRRSFNNDLLYATTFSQYVQALVIDGDSEIEFFIEGTRSRTAKSLVPKYGFLSMALKPFLTGLVPDVTIVPINISYDRVLEEILFVYELLGVPKPKESTKGFLKALSILNENYGQVYVQFGEPFSVKEFFGGTIDRRVHSFGPVRLQNLTQAESNEIVRLAHSIVQEQNNLTILSTFNLIAVVINNHIMTCNTPLDFDNLVTEVSWFLSLIRALGAAVAISNDVLSSISSSLVTHQSLIRITLDNKIKLLRIHSRNGEIDRSKLKGHNLSGKTMEVAVPVLLIQYYSNPCAHYLINLAFVLLIIECVKHEKISKDELYSKFKFLRLVFSYEFVFHVDTEASDFNKAFDLGLVFNAISESGSEVGVGSNRKLSVFCINYLRPYVPSYLVLAGVLLKGPDSVVPEKNIFKAYQKVVELELSSGSPIHPASLSLDLVSNALQAFVQTQSLKKIRKEAQTYYEINHTELEKITSRLKSFDNQSKTSHELSQHFSCFLNGKL